MATHTLTITTIGTTDLATAIAASGFPIDTSQDVVFRGRGKGGDGQTRVDRGGVGGGGAGWFKVTKPGTTIGTLGITADIGVDGAGFSTSEPDWLIRARNGADGVDGGVGGGITEDTWSADEYAVGGDGGTPGGDNGGGGGGGNATSAGNGYPGSPADVDNGGPGGLNGSSSAGGGAGGNDGNDGQAGTDGGGGGSGAGGAGGLGTAAYVSVTYTVLPGLSVTTGTALVTGPDTVTLGGNCTGAGAGLTQLGVCYGFFGNPTTSDHVSNAASLATGEYTVNLTDLHYSSLYHYRAFANDGTGVVYGDDETFVTDDPPGQASPGPAAITVIGDTYISQNQPTSNVEGLTSFLVQNTAVSSARALLTFDLSVLPAGATIVAAEITLRLLVNSLTTDALFRLDYFTVDYTAAQATWNIRKTGTNWAAAGGFNDLADSPFPTGYGSLAVPVGYVGTVRTGDRSVASQGPFNVGGVTSIVKAALTANVTSNGKCYFMLYQDSPANVGGVVFAASEHGTVAFRPYITVVYTLPGQSKIGSRLLLGVGK